MGKTKSKQIKRIAEELEENGIEFETEFDKNKKILGQTMPSKKMRNKIAGFLTRKVKQEKAKEEALRQ